jgi:hypothetical protein
MNCWCVPTPAWAPRGQDRTSGRVCGKNRQASSEHFSQRPALDRACLMAVQTWICKFLKKYAQLLLSGGLFRNTLLC